MLRVLLALICLSAVGADPVPTKEQLQEQSDRTAAAIQNAATEQAKLRQLVDALPDPPPNQAPTASFTATVSDLSVTFTDGSTDPDGTIDSWGWDFGDGNTSADQHPSHTYAEAGSYQVTLRVRDDANGAAAVIQTLTVSAPQLVSVPWQNGTRDRWKPPVVADFVSRPVDGKMPRPTAHPHPYTVSHPLNGGAIPLEWRGEHTTGTFARRYEREPLWVRNDDGDIVTSFVEDRAGLKIADFASGAYLRYWQLDGERGQNVVGENCVYRPAGDAGWIGLDRNTGRLFRLSHTGIVTTICGPRHRPDVIPYLWNESGAAVTLDTIRSEQIEIVGDVPTALQGPQDFAVGDDGRIFVADRFGNRIAVWDGTSLRTLVSIMLPTGVEWMDGKLYTVSGWVRSGGTVAVNEIDPTSGIIRTVLSGIDGWCIRATSRGTLVVMESVKDRNVTPKGRLWEIDTNGNLLSTRTLPAFSDAPFLDVDRHGTCGPVDAAWCVLWGVNFTDTITVAVGDHWTEAIELNNINRGTDNLGPVPELEKATGEFGSGGNSVGPFTIAIHDREARIALSSMARNTMIVLRPGRETYDRERLKRGRLVWFLGTTLEAYTAGTRRPGFSETHGRAGRNFLGLPTVDDMALWDDVRLATYIQAGMGGTVPRPEITGEPLADLMYWIRQQSVYRETGAN